MFVGTEEGGQAIVFRKKKAFNDNERTTWLQSLHSVGVPLHRPPKEAEKHEPDVAPGLAGPMYKTLHPPLD